VRAYSKAELAKQAELLANHHYCIRPWAIAESLLDRLKPRDVIPTLEWSQTRRVIRKPDKTRTNWRLDLTPYLAPIMAAHDNPAIREIIVPKPSRCGGTVVAENFALKCMDCGPSWDVMWYLAGPGEVSSYADRVLAPMIDDHAGVKARIGKAAGDDKKTFKRLGSQTFELMVMSKTTTTNRQAGYIVFDEPDSYSKDFRSNFLEQGRQRQTMLGNDRKIYACAHPDLGWGGGIAAAWVLSSQGIFIWQCPSCGTFGSPFPTKYWPDVPRFRLSYEKAPEGAPVDQRLTLAARTAVIACPHGCALGEDERAAMVDKGAYMHKGQVLDVTAGITGEVEDTETWGFWIHVLMAKQVGLSELARTLEGAIEHRERTGKSDKLKQVLVRTFGEAFEGAADIDGVSAQSLRQRAKDEQAVLLGEVPPWVKFITAAVDVGGAKFDISFRGWDLEGRSVWLDRSTLRQRLWPDGQMRDISTRERIDDWDVLVDAVIKRTFRIAGRDEALPVAVTTIDVSDGHVTWIGRNFAARCVRAGFYWGAREKPWCRVQLVQGSPRATAPELPPQPRLTDAKGKRFPLGVQEWTLGVHKLKELALERLAISDGGPGQCFFAPHIDGKYFDEYFAEPLIDGSFVRQGPNESLDLFAYEEAARLMLNPHRKDFKWAEGVLPPWAKPVPLQPEGGDPAASAGEATPAAKPGRSLLDRFDALNRN
jgi:phage terminase large subunit GpA-like protein